MYLRMYVSDMLRTMGWAVALLMIIIVLSTAMIAVSSVRSKGRKIETETVEVVSQVEAPPANTKPAIDLHPIVAQLKAELSRNPVPVEDVALPRVEEPVRPTEKRAPATPSQSTVPTQPAQAAHPSQPAPPTVIVGMVPVQKKESKEQASEQKARTGENSQTKAQDSQASSQ